ncbi:MAG: hypothetical protein IKB51_00860 [Clostridia bacterium]|nr:hypothetical protein [Clostridia bacterium]
MKKIDEAVIKETKYIAIWVLILSMLMQGVFLIINKWDYTVILGNVLSGAAVILNFFLMGLGVQNALEKEEKDAKNALKLSRTYRFLFLTVVVIIGVVLPCFSTWTVVIPVFFPRLAICFRTLFDKKQS